ncbi:MAG: OmpA family protein [Bacteroidota bacterium]
MSLRVILLLIFTLFYMLIGHWLYTTKIVGICSHSDAAVTTDTEVIPTLDNDDLAVLTPDEVGPLTFNWSSEEESLNDGFDNYQASILRNLDDENVLEITGYYFADETTPDGYDNMGLARADRIRELFSEVVPKDRIIINSQLAEDLEGMETNPFEAIEFNWIDKISEEEVTIAEINDRTLIFYPFDARVKDQDAEIDAYLVELAKHLNSSGDRVSIVGHTDSTGPSQYNYDLGLQRAILIKNILLREGVARDKIILDSRGESQPIASNKTRAGEQKNRRVVITLLTEK